MRGSCQKRLCHRSAGLFHNPRTLPDQRVSLFDSFDRINACHELSVSFEQNPFGIRKCFKHSLTPVFESGTIPYSRITRSNAILK